VLAIQNIKSDAGQSAGRKGLSYTRRFTDQGRGDYVLEGERRSPMWRERNQKQVPTRCGPLGALWKLTRGWGGGW